MSPRAVPDTPVVEQPSSWVGWIIFAAVMLMMMGGLHAMVGFLALFDPGYYAVTPGGLVLEVDYTTWGWVHLGLGTGAVVTGIALLAGQTWARILAVLLAVVATVIDVGFLAAYPIWMTIMIILNVIAIYALTVHGAEIRSYRD